MILKRIVKCSVAGKLVFVSEVLANRVVTLRESV
jgi:hypothetical protein